MSKKQHIALQSIQVTDDNGVRRAIEPRSEKHSGLFEHAFDAKTEKRLVRVGAIRDPEGTEEHEDATPVETLVDSTVIDGKADPLDHDNDGKKGGSKAGGNRKKAEAPVPAEDAPVAADETKPSEDLLG